MHSKHIYKRINDIDKAYEFIQISRDCLKDTEINESYTINYNFACYAALVGYEQESCDILKEVLNGVPEWHESIIVPTQINTEFRLVEIDFKYLIENDTFKDILGLCKDDKIIFDT